MTPKRALVIRGMWALSSCLLMWLTGSAMATAQAPLCPSPVDWVTLPRPAADNGWGVHFGPGAASPEPEAIRFFVAEMQAMQLKWVKIINRGSDPTTDALVEALVEADMQVVMRIQDEDLAPFHPPDLRGLVHHYRAKGVHYFELYNEPNLKDEWPAGAEIDLARLVDVWLPAAHAVQQAGGYPSTPALAPGGHWEDIDFWQRFLREVRHRAETGDALAKAVLCGNGSPDWPSLWLASHNYGLNHYFDYPADPVNRRATPVSPAEMTRYDIDPALVPQLNQVRQDPARPFFAGGTIMEESNGFFKFQAQVTHFRELIGYTPPVIITEGGWRLGDAQDPRYPPVNETFLVAETLRGYEYLRDEAPPYLLTWLPWLLCNQSCNGTDPHFESHAWYPEREAARALGIVAALKGQPAQERRPATESPVTAVAANVAARLFPLSIVSRLSGGPTFHHRLTPLTPPQPATRFGVSHLRRLACHENRGKANLFVEVLDERGHPLDGVSLDFNTQLGDQPVSGTSGDKAPGRAEFPLVSAQGGGVWTIQVAPDSGGSRLVEGLRTDLPDDPCPTRGNTQGHYSYTVTFQRGAEDVIPRPRHPLQVVPPDWRFPQSRSIPQPGNSVQLKPLSGWPRPQADNGWGLHFLPLAAFDDLPLDLFLYHMQELDLRWATVYYEDEATLHRAARKFRQAGIIVIWRPKLRPYEPYPAWRIERDLAILREFDMPPYLQLYNEPALAQEWDGRSPDPDLYLHHVLAAADAVYRAGGYIGVQDVDVASLTRLLNVVKADKPYLLREMFFLPHCYGSNHPPDYPYDLLNRQTTGSTIDNDYNASVLCFLRFAQVWQETAGFIPPMIMSEGGWATSTLEDDRYPRLTPELHRDYHQAMFDWFRSGQLSHGQPLPDYLFAITPWLVNGGGQLHFEEAGWFYSPLTGSKYLTIEAIRNIPPFGRTFRNF